MKGTPRPYLAMQQALLHGWPQTAGRGLGYLQGAVESDEAAAWLEALALLSYAEAALTETESPGVTAPALNEGIFVRVHWETGALFRLNIRTCCFFFFFAA